MTTGKWVMWTAGGVLACVLTWPAPLAAQPTSLPESMTKGSRDMVTIRSQLEMAQQFGRRAMQGLQASPSDDSTPLDERTIRAFRDTYVLIRAAKQGLDLRRDRQKYPDPVLELAYKRLFDAWNLSRTPVDKLSWGMPRAEYLAMSIRDMGQALRLVDQVLVILP